MFASQVKAQQESERLVDFQNKVFKISNSAHSKERYQLLSNESSYSCEHWVQSQIIIVVAVHQSKQ